MTLGKSIKLIYIKISNADIMTKEGDEVKPFKDMTAKEAFKSVYFWSWMEEVHPTLNLIIWAAVLGISGMSLLFSIIALVQ